VLKENTGQSRSRGGKKDALRIEKGLAEKGTEERGKEMMPEKKIRTGEPA